MYESVWQDRSGFMCSPLYVAERMRRSNMCFGARMAAGREKIRLRLTGPPPRSSEASLLHHMEESGL